MAADISATMASLSATEGSNQPTNATTVGQNVDDNFRMVGALLAAFREACGWGGLKLTSVAGSATAITAAVAAQGSITMAPTAYSTGMRFHLIPAASNTGATTLNVNSLGAKNIFLNGAALVGYELRIGCPVIVEYDGTQFNLAGGAHGGDGVALGVVRAFAGTTAPVGNLFCYGQAISRTTYADLFALVGTTYGVGDGSTTFNLPDLRGRVVAGQDDMGGVSANRLTGITGSLDGDVLGATGGAESVTITTAMLPASGLSIPSLSVSVASTVSDIQRGPAGGTFGYVETGSTAFTSSQITSTGSTGTGTTGNMGTGGVSPNVPPTLILNMIIKH